MKDLADQIQIYHNQVDTALENHEKNGQLDIALQVYMQVEINLSVLKISPTDPQYKQQQAALAYTLMRQANILRQQGDTAQARMISQREIQAARNAGDDISLARSLMSYGATLIALGQVQDGLDSVDEAYSIFTQGESYDHQQGCGWYWILRADIANAGLQELAPEQIIDFADQALSALESIENWPGVARAYAARAIAYERLGDNAAASADRQAQDRFSQR
jgi:tetratricopeptide (TPR) repeat protein